MSKLTKEQTKLHDQACEILQKPTLTDPDKEFVLANWHPSASDNATRHAAFFTPFELAFDLAIETPEFDTIVDLGAGIGALSYAIACQRHMVTRPRLTCVERNPAYAAVGRKIVPEATWIVGDMFDEQFAKSLGQFDYAVSNPPFGASKGAGAWLGHKGPLETLAVALAMRLSRNGATLILPQGALPFRFSGIQSFTEQNSMVARRLLEDVPGLRLGCSSCDTSAYDGEWRDASPKVEIVLAELDTAALTH